MLYPGKVLDFDFSVIQYKETLLFSTSVPTGILKISDGV